MRMLTLSSAVENGLTGYELNKLPLETVMTLLKVCALRGPRSSHLN